MKLILNPNQRLWFTSDTHFNHANICSATTKWKDPQTVRNFKSLSEMNDTLVNNINELVMPDDILIHNGDWSFGGFDSIEKFRKRLICENIHLILGNHDHHIARNKQDCQSLFVSVSKYMELSVSHYVGNTLVTNEFVLSHYPIASWNNLARGAIHLHGHVHLPQNKRIGPGKMMDIGVDGNNLYPISTSEILKLMKNQPIKSMMNNDHHEKVENYV